MLKKVFRPIYQFMHDVLYMTSDFNPLFKKIHNGNKVIKGFIGDEHLSHPSLDDELKRDLVASGVEVAEFSIDESAYRSYLVTAGYPSYYYGGGNDPDSNFTEKTLEHFVTTELIDFSKAKRFMDVAACNSPFAEIVKKIYRVEEVYQQDLIYDRGIHNFKIGGCAHETGLPACSIDAITLHCSLEHFEDNSDVLFFKEVNRLLAPGGKCIILPFYIAHTYTIHIDPAFNLLRNHHPVIDENAKLRYCNWYQFHSRHYDVKQFHKRILSQMPDCKVRLYMVNNFRQIDKSCYLRWILEISK